MSSRVRLQGSLFRPIVPNGAVDITRRGILSGLYGNPFTVKRYGREEALRRFYELLHDPNNQRAQKMALNVEVLKGKDLACWCKPEEDCHGDILLEWLTDYCSECGKALASDDVEGTCDQCIYNDAVHTMRTTDNKRYAYSIHALLTHGPN